jgi:hypothetical protein
MTFQFLTNAELISTDIAYIMMDTQSRKLGIRFHRTFGPVNCEEIKDRTRFYRTDNKIMIFFLNNQFILFKCHILITLNLQSQTAISTIREQRKG